MFVVGCVGKPIVRSTIDFYGKYRFSVTIDNVTVTGRGNHVFQTELTLEEIKESLIGQGYIAEIYNVTGSSRLFITSYQNNRKFYFMILPLRTFDVPPSFIVLLHRIVVGHGLVSRGFDPSPAIELLFPVHVEGNTVRGVLRDGIIANLQVFADFDYIANYYSSNGMNDSEVLADENAIIFHSSRFNSNGNSVSTRLQFVQGDGDYNWIEISLA